MDHCIIGVAVCVSACSRADAAAHSHNGGAFSLVRCRASVSQGDAVRRGAAMAGGNIGVALRARHRGVPNAARACCAAASKALRRRPHCRCPIVTWTRLPPHRAHSGETSLARPRSAVESISARPSWHFFMLAL